MRKDLRDFKMIQIKGHSQAKASAMKIQLRNLKRNQDSIKAMTFTAQVTSKPHQQTVARFPKKI